MDHRSQCPIAVSLDLLGDRWTLVLIRDLLNGKSKFSEFLQSPERISTNILTDRLGKMEASGLVTRSRYQERPRRYQFELTEMGRGLHPVLCEICRWGNRFFPDTWTPPDSFMQTQNEEA